MSDEREKSTEAGAAFFLGGVLGWLARGLGRPSQRVTLPASPQEIASLPNRPGQSTPKNTESVRDCGCAERRRAADRSLDPVGINLIRRERSGAFLVVLLFAAAMGGSIGFLVTYWTGGSNQMLGGTLTLFFGGLGAAAVIWAHNLTANKEAVGPRERGDAAEAHNAAAETFAEGTRDIQRRKMLAWMSAGGAGLFGAMVLSAFRSLGLSPDTSLYTEVWKRGQRLMTVDGKPVRVDALTPGSTTIVFPEDSVGSEKAQTVLLRVDPDLLRLPRQRVGWAPMGNLAYSRVCTHAGCSVGMYETTSHQLMCPCHQSTFDVLNGAEPTGGPAARPLPQLPLYADSDGILRAAGGFSEPPGPGFWGMPS